MPDSKIVEIVSSGVPELVREVYIYDTTKEKIRQKHPREYENWVSVVGTIESPTRVHKSKTHDRSIVFINDAATSPGGDPMRVPVKVMSDGTGIMGTAHYSSSKDQGILLWSNKNV